MTSAITTVNLQAREMMAGNCDVLATYAGTSMSDGKASDMVPDVETLVPGAPGCERFGAGDATWQS